MYKEWFNKINKRFPTIGDRRHCFTLCPVRDQVVLSIWIEEKSYDVYFETEEDLNKMMNNLDDLTQLFESFLKPQKD